MKIFDVRIGTLGVTYGHHAASSSEVGAGSREENASKQESRASALIPSERKV
jgi:hypothetical protein